MTRFRTSDTVREMVGQCSLTLSQENFLCLPPLSPPSFVASLVRGQAKTYPFLERGIRVLEVGDSSCDFLFLRNSKPLREFVVPKRMLFIVASEVEV